MAFLTKADRRRIEAAVAAAERRTSAEFVTVVARRSADYRSTSMLAAGTAMLVLSGAALLTPFDFSIVEFYAGQALAFVAFALLFSWTPIRMRLVPRAIKRRRAHLLAHAQFLDLGLSSTTDRTGVMLFVSAAEHYVEILVDRRVRECVGDEEWRAVIAAFVAAVRDGRVADGFVQAIEASGDRLASAFPWTPDDRNELPNRLVEL